MQMRITGSIFVIATMSVTSLACADIDSGPKVGAVVAPLKVFVATGDQSGKEIDCAAERVAKPTVYIFLQHERFDRPLARLLKALEKDTIDLGNDAAIVTVFLTSDEVKTKEHLPRVQKSLQFTVNSLTVYPSSTMGPDGWSVNTDAHLTAVVVKDGKVAAVFGYRSANETVAPEIAAALKQAMGK